TSAVPDPGTINQTVNGITHSLSNPISNLPNGIPSLSDSGLPFGPGSNLQNSSPPIGMSTDALREENPLLFFPGLADSAALNLLMGSPDNPNMDVVGREGSLGTGESITLSQRDSNDGSEPAGEDREILSPQADGLRENGSADSGALSFYFQKVLD